jgi:hypothetical protein
MTYGDVDYVEVIAFSSRHVQIYASRHLTAGLCLPNVGLIASVDSGRSPSSDKSNTIVDNHHRVKKDRVYLAEQRTEFFKIFQRPLILFCQKMIAEF